MFASKNYPGEPQDTEVKRPTGASCSAKSLHFKSQHLGGKAGRFCEFKAEKEGGGRGDKEQLHTSSKNSRSLKNVQRNGSMKIRRKSYMRIGA